MGFFYVQGVFWLPNFKIIFISAIFEILLIWQICKKIIDGGFMINKWILAFIGEK